MHAIVLHVFVLKTNFAAAQQPERINPSKDMKGYDIRSDVWSLGISMVCNSRQTGLGTMAMSLLQAEGHFPGFALFLSPLLLHFLLTSCLLKSLISQVQSYKSHLTSLISQVSFHRSHLTSPI